MSLQDDHFYLGVKALICNAEGKLLLLKRNPNRLKSIKEVWDLPGGRIQTNESLEDALKREVGEETGLNSIVCIRPFKMVLSDIRLPTPDGDVGLVLATYFCHVGNEATICLSDEHVDFDWVELSQAAELLAVNFPKELVEALTQVNLEHALRQNLPNIL